MFVRNLSMALVCYVGVVPLSPNYGCIYSKTFQLKHVRMCMETCVYNNGPIKIHFAFSSQPISRAKSISFAYDHKVMRTTHKQPRQVCKYVLSRFGKVHKPFIPSFNNCLITIIHFRFYSFSLYGTMDGTGLIVCVFVCVYTIVHTLNGPFFSILWSILCLSHSMSTLGLLFLFPTNKPFCDIDLEFIFIASFIQKKNQTMDTF